MNSNQLKGLLPAFVILTLILLLPNACKEDPDDGPFQIDNELGIVYAQLPYDRLSDYNFFEGNLADLNPVARVLPYDLNTPLFSDYAKKPRFVWMPEGQAASYDVNQSFDFPLGTILIKNFYFENDFTNPSLGRKLIETRLLVKQDTAWQALTYVWNAAQIEAELSVVGGDIPLSWVHYDGTTRNTYYHIPNKNECKGCHNLDNVLLPLGPNARNLNKNYIYEDGIANQLDKWTGMGYLSGSPDAASAPRAANYDDPNQDLNDRARTYLDVNCGHCHNPLGSAKNSGLTLTMGNVPDFELGICKPPVAAGQGSGGLEHSIVPGEPENSIMYYRMNSTELDVMMPELGRSVIHDEGLALIYEWIASLEGDCN